MTGWTEWRGDAFDAIERLASLRSPLPLYTKGGGGGGAETYLEMALETRSYTLSHFLLGHRASARQLHGRAASSYADGAYQLGDYRYWQPDQPPYQDQGACVDTSTYCTVWSIANCIQSDAALMKADPGYASIYETFMNDARDFVRGSMFDWRPVGGYFAACSLDGDVDVYGEKYMDDNPYVGLAFLDAAEATTGAAQNAYLHFALEVAGYVEAMIDEQWNDGPKTGGGLWWCLEDDQGGVDCPPGDPPKVPPTPPIKNGTANATAALFFSRLLDWTNRMPPAESAYWSKTGPQLIDRLVTWMVDRLLSMNMKYPGAFSSGVLTDPAFRSIPDASIASHVKSIAPEA